MCGGIGASIGCNMCKKTYHQECGYIKGAISVFDKSMSKSVCWACKDVFKNETGIPCIQKLFDFDIHPAIAAQQQPRRQVQQQPRQIQQQPRQTQQQPRQAQPAPVARNRRDSVEQRNLPQRIQPWRICRNRRVNDGDDFEIRPQQQRQPKKISNRRATIGFVPPTKPAEQPNNLRDGEIIDRYSSTTPAQQIIPPAVVSTESREYMGSIAPRTQPKKILNRRVTIANMMPSPPVQKIPASTKMAGVVGVQPPGCNMCEEELPINENEAYEEGAVGGVRENLHLIQNSKSDLLCYV
jgi:hypothetical protein